MGIERGDLRKKISMLFYSCFSQNDFRQIRAESEWRDTQRNRGFSKGFAGLPWGRRDWLANGMAWYLLKKRVYSKCHAESFELREHALLSRWVDPVACAALLTNFDLHPEWIPMVCGTQLVLQSMKPSTGNSNFLFTSMLQCSCDSRKYRMRSFRL